MKEYIKNFDEAKLKEAFKIKEAYSSGEIPLDMANAQMKAHIGTLTPAELAYIEQHFQEKVDDECIKENLEEMLAIYDGVLIEEKDGLQNGHPIKNYMDENLAIRKIIADMDKLLQKSYIKNEWDEKLEALNKYKIHLSRKQNQLYTELERKGFDRPTTTMWLFDNEVRDRITALTQKMSKEFSYSDIKDEYDEFKAYILDLMDKEENILYPTSLELLDDDIFVEMISGDKEIGYCLITPSDEYIKDKKIVNKTEDILKDSNGDFQEDLIKLLSKYNMNTAWTEDTPMNVKQGILSLNQINLIFQHLPVDISYVDENELVAFYSDTKHRVFPRSKGVIGRDVKNCHPANSVHIVEEIIEKFRNGEQDRAEFWINKPGVFIYILYVAVRDANGKFKGVMEMMQDCYNIRELQGSKTLLDWSDEKVKKTEEEDTEEDSLVDNNDNNIRVLKPDTKIDVLLKQYPGLKDYLIGLSDKFAIMKSPMFKVMVKVATVKMVSEKSGLSIEKLQEEFNKYIESLK